MPTHYLQTAMKQLLKALTGFPRLERLSIAVFSLLLVIIFIFRYSLSFWVAPEPDDAEQQSRLTLAYNNWKVSSQPLANGETVPNGQAGIALFSFDPNTLDSTGFIHLGMPPRAVKGLLNWRRKGKHFYKPEDLKPLYNLPEDVYARIAPYVHIAGNSADAHASKNSFPAIPAIIDLNTADSAMLDRGLPGVGATLSHKIMERRKALGGFLKVEQLMEVYKFPDTTFQKMKEKLRINPASVKRMNLNTVMLAQMSAHPYVGEKTARNILLFRDGISRYQSVEQLRQVPLMNEEIYRKIAPYFMVE